MSRDVSKILIGLDELLDTRLATIAKIDQQAATKLLESEIYWDRETDHWEKLTQGRITQEAFNEVYRNRDNNILRNTTITGLFVPLIRIHAENQLAIEAGAPNKEIAIEINIWPYTLELEEMDVLSKLLKDKLNTPDMQITYCSVSLEDLTPQYLVTHYVLAFMYHFNEWIKIHLKELVSHRNPDFNLIIPKRFELDVDKLSIEDKKIELTSFRIYLLEYMDITFIDLQNFSIIRP